MKTIKVLSYSEIPKNFTGLANYSIGLKEYYVDGKFHRLDGPAVEFPDKTRLYFINGRKTTKEAVEVLNYFLKLKMV